MKVYGQLEKAQAENVTSDTASLPEGMLQYRTDTNVLKVSDGSTMKELVDLTTSQTLSGKTHTTPIIDDSAVLEEISTPAAPSAGYRKLYPKTDGKTYTQTSAGVEKELVDTNTAQNLSSKTLATPIIDDAASYEEIVTPAAPSSGYHKIYPKSDGWYSQNSSGVETPIGSGSSGSGKNYFPTAVNLGTATTGFSQYADAAGLLPVDGNGGSPSGNFSIAASGTSPLSGTSSLVISKDAANRQGEGISTDFSIDVSDRGKVLAFSMNYAISSGTYADDDVIVYFYDVTNSALVEPVPYKIKNHSLTSDKFFCEVQVPYTCASLRMIIHCSSTSASAYSLKIDDLLFGPQAKLYGSVVTDWQSFTPTGSWVSNTTYTGKWRRIGDSMEAQVKVSLTGAPTAAALDINLPSGYSIDTMDLLSTATSESDFMLSGIIQDNGGNDFEVSTITYNSSNSVRIHTIDSSTTYGIRQAITNVLPITFGASDSVFVVFRVPIVGWSSSQVLSSEADTRTITCRAYRGTSAQAISSSAETTVIFNAISKDSHAGFNTSTGQYSVKSSGDYKVVANLYGNNTTSGEIFTASIRKNGVAVCSRFFRASTGTDFSEMISDIVPSCVAGDLIDITIDSTADTSYEIVANTLYSFVSIDKILGPSQIAASESVSIGYDSNSAIALAYNANTAISLEDKEWDSHSAYSSVFTAPISGEYEISAMLTSASVSNVAGGLFALQAFKNGSYHKAMATTVCYAAITTSVYVDGTTKVKLLAGETLGLGYYQSFFVAGTTLNGVSSQNWIRITRVGNY